MDNRARLVALLGALCCLGPLSIDTYLPAFPSMAEEFDATGSQIQLSLTTFIIGLSAGSASAVLGVTTFLVGGLMAPLVGAGGSASVLPMVTVMAGASVLAVVLFATLTRGDVGITRDTEPAPVPA
ncbi:hypothetical protein [Saccharothrix deserti]|uniref:hypothetical protein n=1 Tax=Saccharothrix deserti TaxID=2593674 RepID=UPI00131C772C|nr:hypothetical protein [Saccharothrix deserti]